GDHEGFCVPGGLQRIVCKMGAFDELELPGLVHSLGIVSGDMGSFAQQVVDQINGHGGADVIGIGLEGQTPYRNFFVAKNPEGVADFPQEAVSLAAVDVLNLLEEGEGNAELLADGDEGGDILWEAGSTVADACIEEVSS